MSKRQTLRMKLGVFIICIAAPWYLKISGITFKCTETRFNDTPFVMDNDRRNAVSITGPFWLRWYFYRNKSTTSVKWYLMSEKTKHSICNITGYIQDGYTAPKKMCSQCRVEYKEAFQTAFFRRFIILAEQVGGENNSVHINSSQMDFYYKAPWDIQQNEINTFTCSRISTSTTYIAWNLYSNGPWKEHIFDMKACEFENSSAYSNRSLNFSGGNNDKFVEELVCMSNESVKFTLKDDAFKPDEKLYIRCSDAFNPYRGSTLLLVQKGKHYSYEDTNQQVETCGRRVKSHCATENLTGILDFFGRNMKPIAISAGTTFSLLFSSFMLYKQCNKKKTVDLEECYDSELSKRRPPRVRADKETILKSTSSDGKAYFVCP